MVGNRFNHKIKKEIRLTSALSNVWRQFLYITYFEIENPTLYSEDVEQSKIMWEAYKHFHIIKKEPDIIWEGWIDSSKVPKPIKWGGPELYDVWRKQLLPEYQINRKEHICFSFLSNKKDAKGLDDECLESIINLLKNQKCCDLGNSRDFPDAKELIKRVNIIAHSALYLGSDCSWSNICPAFSTPVVLGVQEWPFQSLSIFKQNFIVDKNTGIPLGFKRIEDESKN
tara:strand:+ start:1110 stop:1790 length:681 start_codon:yes stop_codon:yes gene_type:complete